MSESDAIENIYCLALLHRHEWDVLSALAPDGSDADTVLSRAAKKHKDALYTLRGLRRQWSITEVLEVCRGCSRPDCRPFKEVWGDNEKARFDWHLSYMRF